MQITRSHYPSAASGAPSPGKRPRAADDLLARSYAEWRRPVTARARRRLENLGIDCAADDLDAAYNEAWYALHQAVVKGDVIRSPPAFLAVVMFRRAIDDVRRSALHRRRTVPIDESRLRMEDGVAGRMDAFRLLERIRSEMSRTLNDREYRAATLCFVLGFRRADAARIMDMPARRFERLMDGRGAERPGVAKKMAAVLRAAAQDQQGCDAPSR